MNSNIFIIGRVTKDFELSKVGDKMLGKFTVVVDSGKKDEEGKSTDGTFYTVETWNENQQAAWKELKKGENVGVQGNLEIDNWSSGDKKGTSLKIKNPNVHFLSAGQNASVANVSATCNLVKDPEHITTPNGKKGVKFSVAANDRSAKSDDKDPNFFEVELWGERAKVADYLKKGSPVSINGNLSCETYERKDGAGKNTSVKLINPEITFLDNKKEDGCAEKPAPAKTSQGAQK